MAIPSPPTNVVGSAGFYDRLVTIRWDPGSLDETSFELEASINAGGLWSTLFSVPAGAYWAHHRDIDPAEDYLYRVRAVNGDGASAWVEAEDPAVWSEMAVTEDVGDNENRVWIMIGSLMAGADQSLAVSGAVQRVAKYYTANFVPGVPLVYSHGIRSSEHDWQYRDSTELLGRVSWPFVVRVPQIWDHVGKLFQLTVVTPGASTTTITVNASALNPIGVVSSTRRFTIAGTGISGLDGQVIATVTNDNTFTIPGVFSGSPSPGAVVKAPQFLPYHAERNAHTDETFGGASPSEMFGPEAYMMMQAQEVDDTQNSNTYLVKYATGLSYPALRSRSLAAPEDTVLHPQYSGETWSLWDDLDRILTDAADDIANDPAAEATTVISGIILGCGYGECLRGNSLATSRTRAIANLTISGTPGKVTVTTDSAIGLSEPTGIEAKLVARISGLVQAAGTVQLNDTIQEITITGSTSFTIEHYDATGLTPGSFAGGTVTIADPIRFLSDDIITFVDAVRDACIAKFAPADQVAEDIPVGILRMDPSKVPPLLNQWVYGPELPRVGRQQQEQAAAADVNARIVDIDGVSRAGYLLQPLATPFRGREVTPPTTWFPQLGLTAVGVPDDIHYSALGQFQIGERIWNAITKTGGVAIGSARQPVPMIGFIGPSFCVGTITRGDDSGDANSMVAQFLDGDLDLLIHPVSANPDNVLESTLLWNHALQLFEQPKLWNLPQITNCNSNPIWNIDASHFNCAGSHAALLRGVAERFPGERVHMVNLGANGSTFAPYAITNPNMQVPGFVSMAVVGPDTLQINLSGTTSLNVFRVGQPTEIHLTGVSGLSKNINNTTFLAIPQAPLGGATVATFQVAGGISGTPDISGARLFVRNIGIWDPNRTGDLWDAWERQVKAAMEFLWDSNQVADPRALFIVGGINEAILSTHEGFEQAIRDQIAANRELFQFRARPRHELGIVWLKEPMHHLVKGYLQPGDNTYQRLLVVREAYETVAAEDSRFALLRLDESDDFLRDPFAISYDTVHPTVKGYQQIGYRLAREGLDAVEGFDAPSPYTSTPHTPSTPSSF